MGMGASRTGIRACARCGMRTSMPPARSPAVRPSVCACGGSLRDRCHGTRARDGCATARDPYSHRHEEYARNNGSYGPHDATDDHVRIRGARVPLRLRDKSGRTRHRDQRAHLARLVSARATWGEERSRHHGAGIRTRSTRRVNAYTAGSQRGFTAKDFRTGRVLCWQRCVTAAARIRGGDHPEARITRREATAGHLGNTPTVCGRLIIHHPRHVPGRGDACAMERVAEAESRERPAFEEAPRSVLGKVGGRGRRDGLRTGNTRLVHRTVLVAGDSLHHWVLHRLIPAISASASWALPPTRVARAAPCRTHRAPAGVPP